MPVAKKKLSIVFLFSSAMSFNVAGQNATGPVAGHTQAQPELAKQEALVEETLNTIEAEDEGNWVLKRVWWEQSEDLFGQIINLNDQVVQVQVKLIAMRNESDKEVADFFKAIGVEQTKIKEMVEYLLTVANTPVEGESAQDLIDEERDLIAKINMNKAIFDSITHQLQTLQEQDSLITEAMTQLMNLVNECRNYENSSWKNFKEIGRILNDERAKELYYEIESNYKNIQAIIKYINGELSEFITKSAQAVKNASEEIKKELDTLASTETQLHTLVQEHKDALEKKIRLQEQAEQKRKAALEQAKKPAPKKGFLSTVSSWFSSLFTSIKKFFGIK